MVLTHSWAGVLTILMTARMRSKNILFMPYKTALIDGNVQNGNNGVTSGGTYFCVGDASRKEFTVTPKRGPKSSQRSSEHVVLRVYKYGVPSFPGLHVVTA